MWWWQQRNNNDYKQHGTTLEELRIGVWLFDGIANNIVGLHIDWHTLFRTIPLQHSDIMRNSIGLHGTYFAHFTVVTESMTIIIGLLVAHLIFILKYLILICNLYFWVSQLYFDNTTTVRTWHEYENWNKIYRFLRWKTQ